MCLMPYNIPYILLNRRPGHVKISPLTAHDSRGNYVRYSVLVYVLYTELLSTSVCRHSASFGHNYVAGRILVSTALLVQYGYVGVYT